MSPLNQGQRLALALESLPKYAVAYVAGIIEVIITDFLITSLFVGCVLLAFASHAALVGLAAFFLGYTFLRTINSIANAIGSSGMNIARRLPLPTDLPPSSLP